MIKKAVIPAAGLGTRLLPYTKETPKEMLPLFVRDNNDILLKPLIHRIFEELYALGTRIFIFIVGRGKRVLEDYFTPDYSFIELLKAKGKTKEVNSLERFYSMIENSEIIFINQPKPLGFGHAVLRSKIAVGKDHFLVHAGDTLILSPGDKNRIFRELIGEFDRRNPEAIFLVKKVKDPRMFGVVIGEEINDRLIRVEKAVEKPKEPISHWAIMPVYIFKPTIFDALEKTKPGPRGEIELTDGIQKLIDEGKEVLALKMSDDDIWIDVGTSQTYREAIILSLKLAMGNQ